MMEKLFYAGFSSGNILIKADKQDRTVVYLEASSETVDGDDEVLLQKALEEEAENYLAKGVLSWDHQHKIKNDPSFIVGEPLDVKFQTGKTKSTLVKGRLYEGNRYAKTIMNMLENQSTRLGASVGGAILSKAEVFNKDLNKSLPVIERIKWDEVAITYKPVNSSTRGKVTCMAFNEFGKSFMFKNEEFQKALEAGGGVDAASFTGGRALIPESMTTTISTKDFWVDLISAMRKNEVVSFSSLRDYLDKHGVSEAIGVEIVADVILNNINKIKGGK